MNKIALIAGSIALAGTATAAYAVPDKPIHSANAWTSVKDGTGCGVTDGNTGAFDPDCRWQIMFKPDKDGAPERFVYQDSGQLQPGQTPPDQALIIDFEFSDAIGTCVVKEVVKPSGEYSSYMHCEAY